MNMAHEFQGWERGGRRGRCSDKKIVRLGATALFLRMGGVWGGNGPGTTEPPHGERWDKPVPVLVSLSSHSLMLCLTLQLSHRERASISNAS